MLTVFTRDTGWIGGIKEICGCSDHTDHFRVMFKFGAQCGNCSNNACFRSTTPYIKCMRTGCLIIAYTDNEKPKLSAHTKCKISSISIAYRHTILVETYLMFKKFNLIVEMMNKDVIQYTIVYLLQKQLF
jgi:hypothetical protein